METSRSSLVGDKLRTTNETPMRWRERVFARMLASVEGGSLRIEFPSGARTVVGNPAHPRYRLTILDSRFFHRVLAGGGVGFGEAYVDGLWTSSNLSGLLTLLARNQRKLGPLQRGFSLLARMANGLAHRARANSLDGSKENIREHYDLSNDFYRTFLDASMTYSSALFDDPESSLEAAQANKIERMLDLAKVGEGDQILEIGSGWGALAVAAARRGCRVRTITLSVQQYEYVLDRVEREGLGDRIEVALQDYREVEGRYDAVLSCEMIEAVGAEFLPGYFRTIRRSLKPGGRAVLQAITIPDERYATYSKGCDWIQKHIFPGGHLPSPGAIADHAHAAGLRVGESRSFGLHYARTLALWQKAFNGAEDRVEALGFDERFRRKWNFYFSYCIAGFDTGLIDVRHVVLE